jgi:predicted ester cyclase
MKQAFPDAMVIPEAMVAEGDKVAVRFTVRGTHRGEFMGIAPTGKEVVVQGMDINRMANGKIVERWGIADSLSMLQQLGVIPSSR